MSCIGRLLHAVVVVGAAFVLLVAGAIADEIPAITPEFVHGSWTLILLPDTQYYSETYPGLFAIQTHWIAKNKEKYNIRYVLGLGDITDGNTDREWQHAQEALSELAGKVPYAIVPGNQFSFKLDP